MGFGALGGFVAGVLCTSLLAYSFGPRGHNWSGLSGAAVPPPLQQQQRQQVREERFVNPLLRHLGHSGEQGQWGTLLRNHPSPHRIAVVEVGCADGNQAMEAVRANVSEIVLVEPSPKWLVELRPMFKAQIAAGQVRLIETAAGNFTGNVSFQSARDGGDHVGMYDGSTNPVLYSNKSTVTVRMETLDNILASITKPIFYLKIDVQGYEPAVLQGLRDTLQRRRVLYMQLEFWPRAMRALTGLTGEWVLRTLQDAGYEVFDLDHQSIMYDKPVRWQDAGRPLRPSAVDAYWLEVAQRNLSRVLPKWDLETNAKFGHWTDIFAVLKTADVRPWFPEP